MIRLTRGVGVTRGLITPKILEQFYYSFRGNSLTILPTPATLDSSSPRAFGSWRAICKKLLSWHKDGMPAALSVT